MNPDSTLHVLMFLMLLTFLIAIERLNRSQQSRKIFYDAALWLHTNDIAVVIALYASRFEYPLDEFIDFFG
jgi:hypothetical protein